MKLPVKNFHWSAYSNLGNPCGDEIGKLQKSFLFAIKNIRDIISTNQGSATNLAASTQEIAATAEEVSTLTEEIAATIQAISVGASKQSELVTNGLKNLDDMANVVDSALFNINKTLEVIEEVRNECVICLDLTPDYACVPCGHKCLCEKCKDSVLTCPICIKKCESIIKIFSS